MSVRIRLRITHQEKPSLRPAIRKSPTMKPDSSRVAGLPSRRNIKNPTPKPVKQPRAQKRSNSLPVSLHAEAIPASRMKLRTETTAVAIRHSHIMTGRIDGRVGEPGVIFHDRGNLHLPRQREKAPSKEAIGKIAGQCREQIGLDNRGRKFS